MNELTERFIRTYQGKEFQSSSGLTKEFSEFARRFKAVITSCLLVTDTLTFRRGHFYCSGFIRRDNNYVYFSISDVRYFKDGWKNQILIRTAKDDKDFTGGSNQYCTLENFKQGLNDLFKRERNIHKATAIVEDLSSGCL